jgi:hypothetical protein
MLNYSWKLWLISFLGILVVFTSVIVLTGSDEEYICEEYMKLKRANWSGIVVLKTIDEQDHNNRIIELSQSHGNRYRISLSFDSSDLFQNIEVGDTLVKPIGSAEVSINSRAKYIVVYSSDCR